MRTQDVATADIFVTATGCFEISPPSKPQVHEWTFPAAADGSVRSIVLSEGRLINFGNA